MNLYGPELKRMFDAPLAMAMPDLSFARVSTIRRRFRSDRQLGPVSNSLWPVTRIPGIWCSTARGAAVVRGPLHARANVIPYQSFEPTSRNFPPRAMRSWLRVPGRRNLD